MSITPISRRRFVQVTAGAGAGLVLGFYTPGTGRFAQLAEAAEEDSVVNTWLRIASECRL